MKRIIPLFLCLIFVLSSCGVNSPYKNIKLPFDGNLYFSMSFSDLKNVCGNPKEVKDRTEVSKTKYYLYEQNVFGRKASVGYGFFETLLSSELVNVTVTFDSITKDEAASVLQQFSSVFSKEAAEIEGYKNTFEEQHGQTNCTFAVGNGATGLEFRTDYDGKTLSIVGIASY